MANIVGRIFVEASSFGAVRLRMREVIPRSTACFLPHRAVLRQAIRRKTKNKRPAQRREKEKSKRERDTCPRLERDSSNTAILYARARHASFLKPPPPFVCTILLPGSATCALKQPRKEKTKREESDRANRSLTRNEEDEGSRQVIIN